MPKIENRLLCMPHFQYVFRKDQDSSQFLDCSKTICKLLTRHPTKLSDQDVGSQCWSLDPSGKIAYDVGQREGCKK